MNSRTHQIRSNSGITSVNAIKSVQVRLLMAQQLYGLVVAYKITVWKKRLNIDKYVRSRTYTIYIVLSALVKLTLFMSHARNRTQHNPTHRFVLNSRFFIISLDFCRQASLIRIAWHSTKHIDIIMSMCALSILTYSWKQMNGSLNGWYRFLALNEKVTIESDSN